MQKQDFPVCPICSSGAWKIIYDGPVRDGAFGKTKLGKIGRCSGCNVDRLAESVCIDESSYEDGNYRRHLGQDESLSAHFAAHDELSAFTVRAMQSISLRDRVIADVGCGGGSLLDHIRGLPKKTIAIEPQLSFASSLQDREYCWFPSTLDALDEFQGQVDVAFSIQVIEHIADPKAFLAEVRRLLKPDGVLILSTPNRNDILMDLLANDFPAFFYRTQHRWCFESECLSRCAKAAGLRVNEVRHIHRYGLANALFWLRDRKPLGRNRIPAIDLQADDLWRHWLEASGRSDNLYMLLSPE